MNFIKKCFDQYNSALTMYLNDAGIVGDLSKQFISETVLGIMYAIKNSSLDDVIVILVSDDPSQLLKLINVDGMANNLGISADEVTRGLEAIAPVMSMIFTFKSHEIVATIASLAWESKDDIPEEVSNL
jgi:hypothetical protein